MTLKYPVMSSEKIGIKYICEIIRLFQRNYENGIFDSGLGGLTVLKEVRKKYPLLDMDYIADTANNPYGTRTPEEVARFSLALGEYLIDLNAEALIIACNTATAYGLKLLRERFPQIPIYGMIEAGAKMAANTTKTGKIGLLATEGTVKSGAYQNALKKISEEIDCVARPGTRIVSLVEQGVDRNSIEAGKILDMYLKDFKDVDTLILGCTHFPVFEKEIQAKLSEVRLVNPALGVMEEMENKLRNEGEWKFNFHHGRSEILEAGSAIHWDIVNVKNIAI